jgi:1-acyl-sn-glycerol-3-phosphate acyltransferase
MKQPSSHITRIHRFQGFVAFVALLEAAVGISLALLVGLWISPKIVIGIVTFYYTWILIISRPECKCGAPWPWFSRNFCLFHWMRQFLSLQLIECKELTEADAMDKAQFVIAVFPHGANADFRVLLDGVLHTVLPQTAHKVRTLAASILFRLPLVRELALWTGCVDASRLVANRLLQRGFSILVLPGGQAEQMRTVHGHERIYLSRRKGFLKIAMQHNTPVVPVYVFGVSDYYTTSNCMLDARLWLLKKLGIAIPFCMGLFGTLICPNPVPTHIVFGKPMHLAVKQQGEPTADELDAAHMEFVNALTELFNQHKHKYGYGERTLEIL